jgi:hypothetical protein
MVSGHEDRNQQRSNRSGVTSRIPQWCPAMKTGIRTLGVDEFTATGTPQWCPAMKTGISPRLAQIQLRVGLASMVSGHEGRNQPGQDWFLFPGANLLQLCPATGTGISLYYSNDDTVGTQPQWCPAIVTGISRSLKCRRSHRSGRLNGVRPL